MVTALGAVNGGERREMPASDSVPSASRASRKCPRRAISGFRNILVHDYLGVDLDTIWQVVAKELPPLRAALLRLTARLPSVGEERD